MSAQPKFEPSSTLGAAAAQALEVEVRALVDLELRDGRHIRAGRKFHVRADELRELFAVGLVVLT